MVTVTDTAAAQLKQILSSMTKEPEQKIRLASGEGKKLGFVLDAEKDGDQVVEHEGEKVLLIDEAVGSELEGAVLDCKDNEGKPQFTLRRQGASA